MKWKKKYKKKLKIFINGVKNIMMNMRIKKIEEMENFIKELE